MIQTLTLLAILLLTIEQGATAAVQGNHIVLKIFNSNNSIIETTRDKQERETRFVVIYTLIYNGKRERELSTSFSLSYHNELS